MSAERDKRIEGARMAIEQAFGWRLYDEKYGIQAYSISMVRYADTFLHEQRRSYRHYRLRHQRAIMCLAVMFEANTGFAAASGHNKVKDTYDGPFFELVKLSFGLLGDPGQAERPATSLGKMIENALRKRTGSRPPHRPPGRKKRP